MRREITTIVFSKNRPCQLELLLRSLKLEDINVIYKSDEYFKSGYKIVKESYPKVNFIEQDNFRAEIMSLTKGYVMFLCDDDVMIRDFNPDCPEFDEFVRNEDIICLNLRMSRDYDYNFLRDIKVEIPEFDNGKWEWNKYKNDWGYPMSATSHIFRAEDIMPIFSRYKFSCPNLLERIIRMRKPNKPLMIGFDKAKIINIPSNRVQNNFESRNGGVPVKKLNNKFLKGWRIDLDSIKKIKSKSCFTLTKYKWFKQ